MKILVETMGEFQLLDPETGTLIRSVGYTVATATGFTQVRAEQLNVVSKLTDEATDEEWLKYVAESDGDGELAMASFLSSYGDGAGVSETKKAKKAKSADPAPLVVDAQ
jgi:hypothetical protein